MNNFLDYLSIQAQQLADDYWSGNIGPDLPERTLTALENIVAGTWAIERPEQRLQILHWITTDNAERDAL